MSKLEFSPEMLEALQTLSALLESDDSLQATLDCVSQLPVAVFPGCDAAGVTLRVDGVDTTAAASDEFTLEMDRIQYETGEGPCLEALDAGEFRQVTAVSEEERWPSFRARAEAQGFGSSLAFPLTVNGYVGSLNIYSKKERAFDDYSTEIGEIFARQANIALKNSHTYVAARRLADHLNDAIETRDVIGQAKGILMEREAISDADAFEMLRTISQAKNIKLREVARRLIEETLNKGK